MTKEQPGSGTRRVMAWTRGEMWMKAIIPHRTSPPAPRTSGTTGTTVVTATTALSSLLPSHSSPPLLPPALLLRLAPSPRSFASLRRLPPSPPSLPPSILSLPFLLFLPSLARFSRFPLPPRPALAPRNQDRTHPPCPSPSAPSSCTRSIRPQASANTPRRLVGPRAVRARGRGLTACVYECECRGCRDDMSLSLMP